ncbi:alpha/beta hydrolase-fold protein [Vibrio sp. PP-XX7]
MLATTQPDPLNLNPYFATDDLKFGKASTLTYGQVSSDDYTQVMPNPAGHLQTYSLFSHQLNNTRKVVVYEPNATYPISANAPLLILFDGDDYLSKVPTPVILDNLIAARKIPPVRAVFLNNQPPA